MYPIQPGVSHTLQVSGRRPGVFTDTRDVCDTPVSTRHPRVYGIRRCIQTPEGVSDTPWRLQYAHNMSPDRVAPPVTNRVAHLALHLLSSACQSSRSPVRSAIGSSSVMWRTCERPCLRLRLHSLERASIAGTGLAKGSLKRHFQQIPGGPQGSPIPSSAGPPLCALWTVHSLPSSTFQAPASPAPM
jgi:hypothetical protein